MTNTNGNYAIAEPDQQCTSTPSEPKTEPLFTLAWFEANISAHEIMLRQKYALLTATDEFAAWQAEHGATENLKAQRDLLAKQQAAENNKENPV